MMHIVWLWYVSIVDVCHNQQESNKLDVYCTYLGDSGSTDEYERLSKSMETMGNKIMAAKYMARAGHYTRALKACIENGTPEALSLAVGIASQVRDVDEYAHDQSGSDVLIQQLISFLIGESDGVPKDIRLVYDMYILTGDTTKVHTIEYVIIY